MGRSSRFPPKLSPALRLVAGMACLIGAALVAAGAGLPGRAAYSAAPEVGSPAPLVAGQTPDGTPVSLADWRGQPVVVNFWATWCVPCAVEMPALQDAARFRPGVRFLGVNAGEPVAVFQPWAAAQGLDIPLIADADGSRMRAYQVRGLPATFFIDREGVIHQIVYGPLGAGQLSAALDALAR